MPADNQFDRRPHAPPRADQKRSGKKKDAQQNKPDKGGKPANPAVAGDKPKKPSGRPGDIIVGIGSEPIGRGEPGEIGFDTPDLGNKGSSGEIGLDVDLGNRGSGANAGIENPWDDEE